MTIFYNIGEIHPRLRGVAFVIAILGAVFVNNWLIAGLVWAVILLSLLWLGGVLSRHLRFILTFVLPIGAALMLVWWKIVGAPPGAELGSAPAEGAAFAGVVIFRLALFGGITQLCLNTIKPEILIPTFRSWGLRGDLLVIVVSALTLFQEMQVRLEQVLTARLAGGFVRRRNIFSNLTQFPFLLRPMFAWILRAALRRGEIWQQSRLLERMDKSGVEVRGSIVTSMFYITLAIVWFTISISTRFR